ncbi:MAG: GNAT family N-acetyltransferase [Gammaproteobacteria bacterium]
MRQPFRISNGMRYRLVRAVVRDQRWLDQLRRSVYRDLFFATFGHWDEARHVRHTAECWDLGQISIIEVDGARVGMIQILDQAALVEVGELQIQPSHQNRGIGSRILSDVVDQAHKRGKTVTLSVALQNARAYEFYRRCGFQQAAQTETHNQLKCEP